MYPLWVVDAATHQPVDQLGLMGEEEGLMQAARLLRKAGAAVVEAVNVEWRGTPSLMVKSPDSFLFPVAVVLVGVSLTDEESRPLNEGEGTGPRVVTPPSEDLH